MGSEDLTEARRAELPNFLTRLSSSLVDALKQDKPAGEPIPDPCYSCIRVDPPVYALSDHLLNAILDQDFSFPSEQLISAIYGYKDMITLALEPISLKCLFIYLLRSPENNDREYFLRLLLGEPMHFATAQTGPSESRDISPRAHRSLLQKLYTMFTESTRIPWFQRMAGKVLTEMLYDSDENCELFGEISGQHKLRSMLKILEGPDIVSSFFASTILRALYHSGVVSGPEWEINGPHSRIMHCVQSADAMEQFRLYTYCHHHHTPDKTNSERPYLYLRTCYEVSTVGEHAKEIHEGPALLLLDLKNLVVINCGKDSSGWRANYLTIMPTSTERQSRYIIRSDGKKERRFLSLQIHDNDVWWVNDKFQEDQITLNLKIRSAYDMMKITKQLESVGVSRQNTVTEESPGIRRSSSLVIPLDMDEDASSEDSERSQNSPWTNESIEPGVNLDFVPETASERLSQSSLTELTRTPTFGDTSSPRRRDNSSSNGPEAFTKGQKMEDLSRIGDSTAEGFASDKASVPASGSAKPTEGATAQNDKKVPDDGPARNTRSRSSQNGSQKCTKNAKPVSEKNMLKPIPPNTQESLIFPRRRSRGKLYTAPTKAMMVDWDEDLRASDRSVEPESQKENDLTSVSSPSSSAPGLKLLESSKQSNRDPRRRQPVAKNKRQPKTGVSKSRKRGKGKAQPKRKVKLLSPTLKSIKKHDNPEPSKPESDNKLSQNRELLNHPTQLQTVTDSMDNRVKTTLEPKKPESSNGQTPDKAGLDSNQRISDSHQGRGQTVAEKLIAALRGSITSSQHPVKKGQANNPDHSFEEVHESPVLQNEPLCDSPQPSPSDQMGKFVNMPDSWTADMSQERTMVDETYPLAMYPIETPDVSQLSSFQNNGDDTDWILGQEDLAVIQEEAGEENGRDRRVSYSASSSSAEPRSTASTFEFYFTGKPRYKKHKGISYGQPDIMAMGIPERITTKGDSEATKLAASALESLIQEEASQPVEFQEPNTRITADKNGSPRVIQQANPAKHELVTLGQKRHATSPAVQQPSMTKRMRGLNQHEIDVTLHTNKKHHAENNAPQNGNGLLDTRFTAGAEGCRNDALEKGVRMTALSTASGVSEATATGSRIWVPFMDRLKEILKEKKSSETSECSELPSSAPTAEQEPVNSSDHEPAVKPMRYTPGVAPSTRGESRRIVAPELSKSNAVIGAGGHMDWQTSLQELHRGMQRTLASNSEHLTRQIEDERSTINEVLNIYRAQCHTVLDQLLEAQTERIRLCKQQMNSIKQQHATVCQELIRCLEENEQSLGAIEGSQ
ncbi:hypothetical protein BDV19DRAFT_44610 [Aspergillus venezuelensis]